MGRTSWADLSRYVGHRERGRLLLERGADLSDEDYWSALGDAWHYSDPQSLTAEQWRRLWLADRPGRGLVMTAEMATTTSPGATFKVNLQSSGFRTSATQESLLTQGAVFDLPDLYGVPGSR